MYVCHGPVRLLIIKAVVISVTDLQRKSAVKVPGAIFSEELIELAGCKLIHSDSSTSMRAPFTMSDALPT